MHILKDEHGNLIPHGAGAEHEHLHEHEHTHGDGTTHCHHHNHDEHGHGHEHSHDVEECHCHDHGHGEECTCHHDHDHDHGHCHSHSHGEGHSCSHCQEENDPKREVVALMTYMVQHNQAHAKELEQMAANVEQLGMTEAAKQMREAVADYEKGNLRLSVALSAVKAQ